MKKIVLLTAVFGFQLSTLFAQQSATLDPRIAEVYTGVPQYTTPAHVAMYEENLGRVEVKHVVPTATENYTLLSSVPLKNKYNQALVYDNGSNFNPAQFNALKYLFSFYPIQDMTYRVDNTEYVIIIHKKP
ncbi:MAG: hypothetical protein EOP49_42955 [Sphingobacteriales bacterium]|nr:MAG: hypothetical protein EOP49_42955 [Sphingobacteriales bacterium]